LAVISSNLRLPTTFVAAGLWPLNFNPC